MSQVTAVRLVDGRHRSVFDGADRSIAVREDNVDLALVSVSNLRLKASKPRSEPRQIHRVPARRLPLASPRELVRNALPTRRWVKKRMTPTFVRQAVAPLRAALGGGVVGAHRMGEPLELWPGALIDAEQRGHERGRHRPGDGRDDVDRRAVSSALARRSRARRGGAVEAVRAPRRRVP